MSAKIKKTKRSISLQVKLDILKRSENGQGQAAIGRLYGLAPSTIRTILRDSEKIKKCIASGSISLTATVLRRHNRTATMIEMEKILTGWIDEQEQGLMPVNQAAIQEKAKHIFASLKRKTGASKNESFQASRGWYEKFKRRSRTNNTDSKPKEFLCTEPIYELKSKTKLDHSFSQTLKTRIEKGGYSSHQIFNVIETTLYWKEIPVKTVIKQEFELNASRYLKESDKVTLLLGANASGSHKLKPLLVYKSDTPKSLEGYNKSTLPVIWKANETSSVTLTVFEDWFVHHFIPSVAACCKKLKLENKALLILNHSPGHPENLDDIHNNIRVLFMPADISKITPPMRQTLKYFKLYYLNNIFIAATKSENFHSQKKDFETYWKEYNIFEAIKLIDESWKDIGSPIIKNSWTNLQSTVEINSRKEDLEEDIQNHILELGTQLGVIFQKDDLDEYLEAFELIGDQFEDVKDEEIQEKTPPKALTSKRLCEIFQHVNAAVEIMHEYDPNVERSLNVARVLSQGVQCYRELYEEKKAAQQISIDPDHQEEPEIPVLCLYSDSDMDI